jgi:hypothetical protein
MFLDNPEDSLARCPSQYSALYDCRNLSPRQEPIRSCGGEGAWYAGNLTLCQHRVGGRSLSGNSRIQRLTGEGRSGVDQNVTEYAEREGSPNSSCQRATCNRSGESPGELARAQFGRGSGRVDERAR